MAILQYGLLTAGFLLLVLAGESPDARASYAIAGVLCLALMLVVSAVRAVAAGEIRMRSRKAFRATMPGQFMTALILTRILPAGLLLFGAGWVAVRGL